MQETSTRDRIVQQADQLFYELGFEHTSFARIAQRTHSWDKKK